MIIIEVDREVISRISNALNKCDMSQIVAQSSRDEVMYAKDTINMILADNPLPERWAVVETAITVEKYQESDKYFARSEPNILKFCVSYAGAKRYVDSKSPNIDMRIVKVKE